MTIEELAQEDYRYAAVHYVETGDASLLPKGKVWTRDRGAYPDEHEEWDSAVAAIDYALENPETAILFGDDNPNEDSDPYPDVISTENETLEIC